MTRVRPEGAFTFSPAAAEAARGALADLAGLAFGPAALGRDLVLASEAGARPSGSVGLADLRATVSSYPLLGGRVRRPTRWAAGPPGRPVCGCTGADSCYHMGWAGRSWPAPFK